MQNWGNWKKCYSLVSSKNDSFTNEKRIFSYLKDNPEDSIGALKLISSLCLFFVNSYSSFVFNLVLSQILSDRKSYAQIPFIGYETSFTDNYLKCLYLSVLKREDIALSDYLNHDFSEISYPGKQRKTFYSVIDLKFCVDGETILLDFSLPSGVYASLFLESLCNNKIFAHKLK